LFEPVHGFELARQEIQNLRIQIVTIQDNQQGDAKDNHRREDECGCAVSNGFGQELGESTEQFRFWYWRSIVH
jgi:hypothetical protein